MDRGNVRDLLAVVIVLVSFQISSAVAGKLQEHKLVEKASVPAGLLNNEQIDELQDQALEVRLLQKRIFNGPRSDASESRKRFAAEANIDADIPERSLQKRWVMSGRPYGRDLPKDREKSETVQMPDHSQKRMFMRHTGDVPEYREVYIPEKSETKFSTYSPLPQERFAMSGKKEGRDSPEQRQPFLPGSEVTQERRMYEHPVIPKDGSEKSYATDLHNLLILRDRVKTLHEKLDETIENYRNRNDDTNNGKEVDDVQMREWEDFLRGFETD